MKRLLILLSLLIMAGCGGGAWLKSEASFASKTQDFAVDLPQGWMRSNNENYLLMTRDGTGLQLIYVGEFDITQEGPHFKHTKKRVTRGMLPQEIAEVLIDHHQSDPDHPFDQVEDNSPATVAGKTGYRLQLVYRTKSGLRYRYLSYGFLSGDRLYQLNYSAPIRYYFDKDRETFETVVKSFRLTK